MDSVYYALYTSTALMPLTAVGGVSIPQENTPGAARPFAATLSVPMPDYQAKKHDTGTTRPPTNNKIPTSRDGKVDTDTTPDTGDDS